MVDVATKGWVASDYVAIINADLKLMLHCMVSRKTREEMELKMPFSYHPEMFGMLGSYCRGS